MEKFEQKVNEHFAELKKRGPFKILFNRNSANPHIDLEFGIESTKGLWERRDYRTKIQETADSLLFINRKNHVNYDFQFWDMSRYYSSSESDTVQLFRGPYKHKLVQGIGLSYYKRQDPATFKWAYEFKLIDYNLRE